MRWALGVAAGHALLRGAGRAAEIPEWELEYYSTDNANRTKDLSTATYATAGGGACLPFTGGCGHLSAMCNSQTTWTDVASDDETCLNFGMDVSAAFQLCKLDALNHTSAEAGVFGTCISEHYPRTECKEACKGVAAGAAKLRCLSACEDLGACFSTCTVEFPWPCSVGECVSHCMGPVPEVDNSVKLGMHVHVVAASNETVEPIWVTQQLELLGSLGDLPESEVEVLKATLMSEIAAAAGIAAGDVQIISLVAGAPRRVDAAAPVDAADAPVGLLHALRAAGRVAAPAGAAGLLSTQRAGRRQTPAAVSCGTGAPVPTCALCPVLGTVPGDGCGGDCEWSGVACIDGPASGLSGVIVVEFKTLLPPTAHVNATSLGTMLGQTGHKLLELTAPSALGNQYTDDLVHVLDAAGLPPPQPDQVKHALDTGEVVAVDPLAGVEVAFPDGEHVHYPSAALVVPEEQPAAACTTVRCGYQRLAHATLGNAAYHAAHAARAADHMVNATRVVADIVDAFTPAPSGPPPTPFPWAFFRKRILQTTDDPFVAFSPATPPPSAAALAAADLAG